jgi:hypothetical protein
LFSAESTALSASCTAADTKSPALDSWSPRVGLASRIRRAARQIGHHWHSADSPTSGGISVVAVSHTSPASVRPPKVRRTWPVISLRMLLALDRSSHRWKSVSTSDAVGGGLRDLDCD